MRQVPFQLRRILLFAPADMGSRRRIVEGVLRFARTQPDWHVIYDPAVQKFSDLSERLAGVDGLISSNLGGLRESIDPLPIPVVIAGDSIPEADSVYCDESAVGAMALHHLRGLGLTQFAFAGYPGAEFSTRRYEGFCDAARDAGFVVHLWPRSVYQGMEFHPHEAGPFAEWLESLPQPVGLLVPTAAQGAAVAEVCREQGIAIPDQVALLGVDDDEILCELSRPRLSIVDQNAEQIGYRAAQLLQAKMQSPVKKAPSKRDAPRHVVIDPLGVIERESTSLLQVDSTDIADAIRYIRAHASGRQLSVGDVVSQVAMSRRALERGFQRNIGRSIRQEIVHARIEQAKRLLHQTELTLEEISHRCGFSYPSKFSLAFKREAGMTPSTYRKQVRQGGISD